MLPRLVLLPAIFAAAIPSLGAVTPTRYAVEATVATAPTLGREPFGSRFFFATGNQVIYRILPADRSDTDPAARLEFWAPGGALAILPASGYESLDVAALNASGTAVGRSVTESAPTPNPHQEAALYWTPANGSTVPAGFDLGASGLKTINVAGQTAGFTDSGVYKFVRWTAESPATMDVITPPAGYPYAEIHGISASGEVLLYVTDNNGSPRLAVWDGASSTVVGPAPDAGETFSAANCAMNGAGDVAMLLFATGGNYRIIYIPAASRAAYQIFSFTGPVTSAYSLQISDAGLASCQASNNTVSIVSSPRAQQFTFSGYGPFLNAPGEFIYGNQGSFYYWDAAAWSGAPAPVPLDLPAAPTTPTLVGFNDAGRLLSLSDNFERTLRTLSILAPVVPTPTPTPNPNPTPNPTPAPAPAPTTTVTLNPVRKTLHLTAEKSISQRVVKTIVSGTAPDRPITYIVRGKLPRGTRLRARDGWLVGLPTRAQQTTFRVAAIYSSAGTSRQSPFASIKVVVRAPASPPTQ